MAQCPECGKECVNEGALAVHHRSKHAPAERCPECGGEYRNLSAHMRKHAAPSLSAEDGARPLEGDVSPTSPLEGGEPAAERVPAAGQSQKRSFRDRVEGRLWGRARDTVTPPPAPTRERRPKVKGGGRRANTSALMSMAYGLAGTGLERAGVDPPVGRVMQFQAPMAGPVLDKFVAGTWIDRIIQPLAAKGDELEGIGALFALPILVGMYERSGPALESQLRPMLRAVVAANLTQLVPVIEKQQADAAKLEAQARSMMDAGIIDAGTDDPTLAMVDAILQNIFAVSLPDEPPPAPSDNGDASTARDHVAG